MKRTNRNDATPICVGAYSVEEIQVMNWEHDRRYGFSFAFPTLYSNVLRLPETYTGPIGDLWKREPTT